MKYLTVLFSVVFLFSCESILGPQHGEDGVLLKNRTDVTSDIVTYVQNQNKVQYEYRVGNYGEVPRDVTLTAYISIDNGSDVVDYIRLSQVDARRIIKKQHTTSVPVGSNVTDVEISNLSYTR